MTVPKRHDEATATAADVWAPAREAEVIDNPIVCFTDGQYATFTRATILASGVLAAELTRTALEVPPGSTPVRVTDTVHYGPAVWHRIYTAPRGVLTAWTWRRNDTGTIEQHRHVVATDVTAAESQDHAISWLRRYAIAESQLSDIAKLAFAQRVTVSDPETIALKFFFQLPPA